MDNYIKIQSVQGGEITSSQNLLDFIVNPSGTYDLSDSFVNLLGEIEVQDAGTQGGTAVYDVGVGWVSTDTEKPHFQNVGVVRNVNLECANKGRIENIREVGVLRQNLSTYTDTQKSQLNQSYIDINQLKSPINAQRYTQFGGFNKVGSTKSIQRTQVPISIRLSDMLEFCRTTEYDTDRAGATRLHLELSRDKLEAVNRMADADVQAIVKKFKNLSGDGTIANEIVLGSNTGADTLKVNTLDQVPYYVGQRVKISATFSAGANPTDVDRMITKITWDRATGEYKLEFNSAWGSALTGAQTYTAITVAITAPTSITYRMTGAELVLRSVSNPRGLDQINYNTYATEQVQGNGATNYQQLFTVEPECSNVVFMFPLAANNLISTNNDIEKWRLRLNNVDLTDRDVEKDSPLDYDRLALTLNAMGYSLRNLTRNGGDDVVNTWLNTYAREKLNTILIMNPLFQTSTTKLLQANITATGTGLLNINLYKQLPRTFTY